MAWFIPAPIPPDLTPEGIEADVAAAWAEARVERPHGVPKEIRYEVPILLAEEACRADEAGR